MLVFMLLHGVPNELRVSAARIHIYLSVSIKYEKGLL